ncbi:MAG: nitrate reductase [Candidatus Binataceae bacterium]
MDALDFARGPGLHCALAILVFGLFWRAVNLLLRRGDLYWVRKAFHLPTLRWDFDSYAMHAGLAVVILGFSGHILLIRELIGVEWPPLPIAIVLFAGVVTLIAMVAVLIHRITSPDPSAFSAFDDYFSWMVVFAAVATGMLAYPHVGGGALVAPYRALLTAHLLCVELLMVWLPFGKLGHVAIMPLGRAAVRLAQAVRSITASKRHTG